MASLPAAKDAMGSRTVKTLQKTSFPMLRTFEFSFVDLEIETE
jgi:hypothetical protein